MIDRLFSGDLRIRPIPKLVVILAAYYFALFVIQQRSGMGAPVCTGDCGSYLVLMGLHDPGDYLTMLAGSFRAWPVTVIFSLFGTYSRSSARDIVQFQTLLQFASWLIFTLALASRTRGTLLRTLLLVIVPLFMFGRQGSAYNLLLLSDSLALSLLLLLMAAALRARTFARRIHEAKGLRKTVCSGFFLLLATFASSARDSSAFMAIAAIPLLLIGNRDYTRERFALCVLVALASAFTLANAGQRLESVNMRNVFVGRLLPNPSARAFLVEHGMPLTVESAAAISKLPLRPPGGIDDDELPQLSAVTSLLRAQMEDYWPHARIDYLRFLVFHPVDVITNWWIAREQIFSPTPFREAGADGWIRSRECKSCEQVLIPILPDLSPVDWLPLWCLGLLTIVSIAGHWMFRSRGANVIFGAGVNLMMCGALDALVSFIGDYWSTGEMQRHTFIGSVFFKIGCAMIVIAFVASLIDYFREMAALLVAKQSALAPPAAARGN